MLNADIRRFAENVVREAKKEAMDKYPTGTGSLANSISWQPFTSGKNEEGISFLMEEYGMYADAGVYGAMKSSTEKMAWATKNIKQKGKPTNSVFLQNKSKFSYKNKAPSIESLAPFIKRNRIRFRTPKGQSGGGQFRAGSYITIAYWMAQRIYSQGLAPSLFFTNPFMKYFTDLPDEVAEQFAKQLGKKIEKQ